MIMSGPPRLRSYSWVLKDEELKDSHAVLVRSVGRGKRAG
jgi:hypothetical protein